MMPYYVAEKKAHVLTKGSIQNIKCPENVEKFQMGGGRGVGSDNQNEMRGRVRIFIFLPNSND